MIGPEDMVKYRDRPLTPAEEAQLAIEEAYSKRPATSWLAEDDEDSNDEDSNDED